MHNLHRFVLERSIRCNTNFVLLNRSTSTGVQNSKTSKPETWVRISTKTISKLRIRPGWAYAQFNDCNITKRAFSHPNISNTFSQTRSIAGIRKHSQSNSSSIKSVSRFHTTPVPAIVFSPTSFSTLYHSPLTTYHLSPVPNDTMEPV